MGDSETHTERWARVLDRLAAGPADYGPHDTEQVCAALERTLDERDQLVQQITEWRSAFRELKASHQSVSAMAKKVCDRNDELRAQLRKSDEITDARPIVGLLGVLLLFISLAVVFGA